MNAKKIFFVSFVTIFWVLCTFYSKANFLEPITKDDTIRYKSGVRKEVADWKNGLIIGTRKLYDRRGDLQEEHTFKQSDIKYRSGKPYSGKGLIKTYYNDTTVASVVPVIQKLKKNSAGKKEYTLAIQAKKVVYGFHKGTQNRSYEFSLDSILEWDHSQYYKRFNYLYPDFVLLHKTKTIDGLNTTITFYNNYGVTESTGQIIDGKQDGRRRFFYENRQVKAEGQLKQIRSTVYYVGEWTFYSESGVITRQLKYYNGEKAVNYISWGSLIDTAKYFFPNGNLKYLILHPRPEDFYHRIDTLEAYYPNEKLHFRYDESHKSLIYKTAMKRVDPFEFSGRYEEFYKSGQRKVVGSICKRPRRKLTEEEVEDGNNKCVTKKSRIPFRGEEYTKKVGWWYYFDEEGNIYNVEEYRLCGELKEKQPNERKIEKINSKYQKNKDDFEFELLIEDNE